MKHSQGEEFTRPVSPRWQDAALVTNFRTNGPNEILVQHAQQLLEQHSKSSSNQFRVLDIGGGAGRNAVPVASLGLEVFCVDLSEPMLRAGQVKLQQTPQAPPVFLAQSRMVSLPFPDQTFDLVIAHGIWNLAQSCAEFRHGIAEAARVAKTGASLFLFTFSRHTIPNDPRFPPVQGEEFVFTQFNGEPQCFLSEEEIYRELEQVGFQRASQKPLTEYNLPSSPITEVTHPPVIYEGTFTRVA